MVPERQVVVVVARLEYEAESLLPQPLNHQRLLAFSRQLTVQSPSSDRQEEESHRHYILLHPVDLNYCISGIVYLVVLLLA